jgi:acyl-CoA thioesterase FadM
MGYRLTSAALGGQKVVTATVSGVVFDYNANHSTPMPDSLRARMLELEASGSG